MKNYFEYFPCGPSEEAWGFHVSAAGFTRVPAGSGYPPGRHPASHALSWSDGRVLPSLQVVFLSAGSGEMETRWAGRREIRKGDALLLWPGVWHRYRPARSVGWTEHWFELSGSLMTGWLEAAGLDPSVAVVSVDPSGGMPAQFQRLHALCRNRARGARPLMAACALEIWTGILACAARGESPGPNDGLVYRAVQRMAASVRRPLSIRQLARRLGVSYPTLHRHFHSETGLSPKQYFEQVRLARAEQLLAASRLSIKEIAASLGYCHAFHFSRHFKLRRGVAPSVWRKREGAWGRRA